MNVRFMIHQPTSAGIPPTYKRPLKRLSHVDKYPKSIIRGMSQPILRRTPWDRGR